MPRDINVFVQADAKPLPPERMNLLLVHTDAVSPYKVYKSIAEVAEDFATTSRTYQQADAMYRQINSLSGYMISDLAIVGVATPTTAFDLVAEMDKLAADHDVWYAFMTDQETKPYTEALSAWAASTLLTKAQIMAGFEENEKLYFFQTNDKTLQCDEAMTVCVYTDNLAEEAAAAYLANVAPFYPESVTWKWKKPDGLTPTALTREDKDRLEEKFFNFMTEENKRQYIKNGACCDGEFIDVVLARSYIKHDIQNRLYDLMTKNANIPYSSQGFTQVAGAVISALERAVQLHMIAIDPDTGQGKYQITIPTRKDATEAQARARVMPDLVWVAELEGSVHSVNSFGTLKAQL